MIKLGWEQNGSLFGSRKVILNHSSDSEQGQNYSLGAIPDATEILQTSNNFSNNNTLDSQVGSILNYKETPTEGVASEPIIKNKNVNISQENGSDSNLAPELSKYLDYRIFLSDFFNGKKHASRGSIRIYSYAHFSAAADIKSPHYLQLVIEGKRNLSPDMTLKFAKALGLNKEKTKEFSLLVEFNQSSDSALRTLKLKELCDYRVNHQIQKGEIDKKLVERFPNWVSWILNSLIDQKNIKFKLDELKKVLGNKASKEEIQLAVKAIIESGEFEIDEISGTLVRKNGVSETPEEIPVALIRKIQSQLLYLGLESLHNDSPTEREIGTLTLALTKEEYEEIRFKLRQFRKQIHKDIATKRIKSKGDRVYQLNLQLFPISQKSEI